MFRIDVWFIVCVVVLAVIFWFLNEHFNNVPKLKGLVANIIIWGACGIVILSVFEPILHKVITVG